MRKWLVGIALLAAYALGQSQPRLTIELQKADSEGGAFYFVEDKQTGTRCYAYSRFYHDGAAISCVPRSTRQND